MAALASATRHNSLALTYQRRATQSWVKISPLARAAAGTAEWASPDWKPKAVKATGHGGQTNGRAKRTRVGGRSRFIPALLNGFFWFVGEEPWSECTWPISIPTSRTPCDDAGGCGCVAVASPACNAQHPKTAAKRLSPATMAMADCHRRGLAATRKFTVRQL